MATYFTLRVPHLIAVIASKLGSDFVSSLGRATECSEDSVSTFGLFACSPAIYINAIECLKMNEGPRSFCTPPV